MSENEISALKEAIRQVIIMPFVIASTIAGTCLIALVWTVVADHFEITHLKDDYNRFTRPRVEELLHAAIKRGDLPVRSYQPNETLNTAKTP